MLKVQDRPECDLPDLMSVQCMTQPLLVICCCFAVHVLLPVQVCVPEGIC